MSESFRALSRDSGRLTPVMIEIQTGEYVCRSVELADTFLKRFVGLIGRRALGDKEGLWITPSFGVHTFGMRFAIDVVMLDRQMRIVKLYREVRPNRIAGICLTCHSALELPAGTITATQLVVGQCLAIRTH